MMSRTKDENDSITEEIRECNGFTPDLAVDIHNNAGGGDGVECFYHHLGGKGKTLAENILTEIVKIGQNSRGTKTRVNSSGKDYYAFIRETIAPAVIVECAFIDNLDDIQILNTDKKQIAMGTAIAKGILKTLGIQYKETSTIYRVQVGAYTSQENAQVTKNILQSYGFDADIVASTHK
jgi:N-acetylmuramoyl-L-alanine amidase